MNALVEKYEGKDFVILGFPCNQFNKQEPGSTPDEIMNGIRYVRPGGGFEPKLTQIFEKIDVNGANEAPLYTYFKGTCGPTFSQFNTGGYYSPKRVGDVYWNYGKFLIGRDGKPYTRYHPSQTAVKNISPDIDYLLSLPVPT